jgi:hypothetical protein
VGYKSVTKFKKLITIDYKQNNMKLKKEDPLFILNGNAIVKDFVGDGYKPTKNLKYHSSWDWLLPAYKKIANYDFVSSYKNKIQESILNVNIDDAFLYLVSWIKEYKDAGQ